MVHAGVVNQFAKVLVHSDNHPLLIYSPVQYLGILCASVDIPYSKNIKTAFLCTKAVAGIMIEKKKGRIISIASGAGIGPNPYAPSYIPYGAGKAGLIGFTKLLARDIGVYGITANTITPGTTLTPRVRKVRDAASIEKIKAQNPMRCLVEPEDTAAAALFLASNEARYITGTNMIVNAGNLMV